MIHLRRSWLVALGLTMFPLAASAHPGDIIPPLKVDFSIRFNVYSPVCPQPTAPWWAYFPADAQQMAQHSGPVFPNWPQTPPNAQPTAAPRLPAAAPNIVFGSMPSAVQPVGYAPPPPAYWYSR